MKTERKKKKGGGVVSLFHNLDLHDHATVPRQILLGRGLKTLRLSRNQIDTNLSNLKLSWRNKWRLY